MKAIQKNWVSNVIWIYLFLSPLLDVVTSLSIHFLSRSMPIILGIKVIFLIFLFILNLKEKEKKSFLYSCILFLYFLFFFFLMYQKKGASSFFLEAQNLFRTFYFPCALLFLYSLEKKGIFQIKIKNICYILFFYLFFLVVPEIFHIGFSSYTQGKVGGLGWYYSTNEISGILAILGPFLFIYLKKKNWWIRILASLFYLLGIFVIGTKVPILAFLITIFCFFFSFLFQLWNQKAWKKMIVSIVCSILCFVSFGFFLMKSSFYQNIKIHLEFLEIKEVSDLFSFHHIDHFIFSERLTFLQNTSEIYRDSSILEKLMGIGFSNKQDHNIISRKMIEMDYFDVFFDYGIVGMILFCLPLFLISWKRTYLLEEKISIFLILLLAFFSGHILIAPSVSIIATLVTLPKKEDLTI